MDSNALRQIEEEIKQIDSTKQDYLMVLANKFVLHAEDWVVDKFIDDLGMELYKYDTITDKSIFLLTVFGNYINKREEHRKDCPHKREKCHEEEYYREMLFRLRLLLSDNDIEIVESDVITYEDDLKIEKTFEIMRKEFEELKLGQHIMHTDIMEDLKVIRNMKYLGKDKMMSQTMGKLFEWTASGMVSSEVSPKLLEIVKTMFSS